MLALRVPELPAGEWIYEMKFAGYRALAFKVGSGHSDSAEGSRNQMT